MKELLSAHNDLIDLPLKNFNGSEIDILNVICSEVRSHKTNQVDIPISKIKELAHYQRNSPNDLISSIEETNRKLMSLNFRLESLDGTQIVQFVLFPTFKIDTVTDTLTVKVNEPFAYLLNNLTGNYTSFELRQSSKLKSLYSKQIFKKFKEFKDTGKWVVSVEDFRTFLDIPKSYKTGDVDVKIIRPSIAELSSIFGNIKVDKEYDRSGKGRPRLRGYIFTFKPETSEDEICNENGLSQDDIAKITGWTKTPRYCPQCHRPIFSKHFENAKGSYFIYAHTDWKTGDCDYSTYDFSDLLEEHDLPPVVEIEDDRTLSESDKQIMEIEQHMREEEEAERRKNKRRFAEMLGGLFGR